MPDVFSFGPLEFPVHTDCLYGERTLQVEVSGHLAQRVLPESIFLAMTGHETQAELIDGIAGAHQDLNLHNGGFIFHIRAKGNPASEDVALRGHQGKALVVGVEYKYASREGHTADLHI